MTRTKQHGITGLERRVPIDTDKVTDASPTQVGEVLDARDAVTDTDEQADVCEEPATPDEGEQVQGAGGPTDRVSRFRWKRMLAYVLLPALALTLASGAGYLKWQESSAELSRAAAAQSTQAVPESIIAMLSYRPDTVDKELPPAGSRLTGKFRDDYTRLINDVVIPGAKQQRISAVAKVPAAASVSATESHAVVLAFVDQSVTIGDGAPTDTASTVRVTLDKVDGRWLISRFEPI